MPVGWTPEIIRSLFPIVFSIGRRITFFAGSRSPSLQLLLPGGPKSFPATVQGWVDLWTTVASTVKPSVVPAGPNHVDRVRRSAVATPFRDAEAALAAEINAPLVLGGVVFRGGHGFGEELRVGAVVDIRMAADAILLTSVIDGSTTYAVPAYRLVEVEASGPGAVTSGGFVATVGHGLVGDLTDRYASEWMTDRFGKTTITTLIRLETDSGELFFRSMTDTPENAQVALSPLRALTRSGPGGAAGARSPLGMSSAAGGSAALAGSADEPDDLVSRLERLSRLHDSGALSDDEYLLAKTKLLS
jgi:hypothetical protein